MDFRMKRRMLYIPVLHIDTNLINARQKIDEVNQLERWHTDEVILINMSSVAHTEAKANGDQRRKKKANQQIFTATDPFEVSDPLFQQVQGALFPQGLRDENQRNDVRIVCEAVKYQAILVTSDGASKSQPGGILGNRHRISDLLKIMSPEESVAFVRSKIRERDKYNERFVKGFGGELPSWSGKD